MMQSYLHLLKVFLPYFVNPGSLMEQLILDTNAGKQLS